VCNNWESLRGSYDAAGLLRTPFPVKRIQRRA
jgi:hypothetical protein